LKKSTFQKHPSTILNELYAVKSHQGAHPKDAQILFIGRDPNWAVDIEKMEIFGSISEYLTDGIDFWKKHKFHHPFMNDSYKGDGKRYHKIFSKLKLKSDAAPQISFIELIGFPTTGMAKSNNKSFLNYLLSEENKGHLAQLDIYLNDNKKTFFVAWGLIEDFKIIYNKTGLFKNIAEIDKSEMQKADLNQIGNIFIQPHFSDAISNLTLEKMENKINQILS
jgi:hypothetical protein